MRISPVDCSIVFGNAVEIPGAPPNLVQEEVTVTMTMPFAKVLFLHLAKTIEAIEKELGNIKVPTKNIPPDTIGDNVSKMLRENPLSEATITFETPSSGSESAANTRRSRR